MENNVQNYFVVFLLGLGTMITLHNTILSTKKYLTRNYGKVSDMLRIICNYGSLWRFLISLGYFMTPADVTSTPCKALGYLYLIGYHLFHISLIAFLLWNIYRMSSDKKDLWFGIVLLLIQTSLVIPEMIFVTPSSVQDMTSSNELFPAKYCDLILFPGHYRLWTMIIFGFVIVIYVIGRLSYLAKNRRRSLVANVPTTTSKSINNNDDSDSTTTTATVVAARRPLDLSTIYWSITLSILTLMLTYLSSYLDEKPDKLINGDNSMIGLAYKNILYILISYIITYLDVEKRKDIIFYNCGGNGRDGSDNVRNSANKLDGEAWIICSKIERKKDVDCEVKNNNENNENNDVSNQV